MAGASNSASAPSASPPSGGIPLAVLIVFRGIGQVFFQESALSGLLIALGLAVSSPVMAAGAVVGSAIGAGTAWLLKFDKSDIFAGIHGFNPTLVGIATFFFFQFGPGSVALMVGGCVAATVVTRYMRGHLPFPTYTTPFIVTTWVMFFVGGRLGLAAGDPGAPPPVANPAMGYFLESTAHGVGQVMFQANLWTALLFLIAIGVSDREHAAWVLLGSVVGMLLASHHVTEVTRSLDPERLIERDTFANISLGLYGYNATLAPVALFLWKRSAIAPLLGMILTVPFTELVPQLGVPALTAPFVLATWAVLALGWLESKYLGGQKSSV